MYITRISGYIALYERSVLSAVLRNHGRSWNVLPAETGGRLYCHNEPTYRQQPLQKSTCWPVPLPSITTNDKTHQYSLHTILGNKVPSENQRGPRAVRGLLEFYGTLRFIIEFIGHCNRPLS